MVRTVERWWGGVAGRMDSRWLGIAGDAVSRVSDTIRVAIDCLVKFGKLPSFCLPSCVAYPRLPP